MRAITVWRQFVNLAVAGIAFVIMYFTNIHAREWGLEDQSLEPPLAFAIALLTAIVAFVVSWGYTRQKHY